MRHTPYTRVRLEPPCSSPQVGAAFLSVAERARDDKLHSRTSTERQSSKPTTSTNPRFDHYPAVVSAESRRQGYHRVTDIFSHSSSLSLSSSPCRASSLYRDDSRRLARPPDGESPITNTKYFFRSSECARYPRMTPTRLCEDTFLDYFNLSQ